MKRYAVITSQCYHERHCFIVPYEPDTFQTKAKALIDDLLEYKRVNAEKKKPPYYGDFEDDYYELDRKRYIVNDSSGDIYIELESTINGCLDTIEEHKYDEFRRYNDVAFGQSRHCDDYHEKADIMEIVKKHFELL